MERWIGSWVVMSLAATVAGTSSQYTVADELKLTLVIYNHAHVSEEILKKTENAASEIFVHAGVRLVWVEGFAYAAERHNTVTPPPEDPATLVIKLQPVSETTRYGSRSDWGGLGLESGAIIFVRKLDATWLGYVIAHELGHILLGPGAHSVVGIMRARLLSEDWQNAAQGRLGFTHSQNQQIRMWIAQRSRRGAFQSLPSGPSKFFTWNP